MKTGVKNVVKLVMNRSVLKHQAFHGTNTYLVGTPNGEPSCEYICVYRYVTLGKLGMDHCTSMHDQDTIPIVSNSIC